MSMFKAKNKKPFIGDNRVTLDAKHNEMMKHFKQIKKSLPEKRKTLSNLTNKYNELKKIPNKELTTEQLNEKFSLADSIKNIKNEINIIENDEEESQYYLQTGDLLCEYYNNIDSIALKSENKENIKTTPIDKTETSIVNFFSNPITNNNDNNVNNNNVNNVNNNNDNNVNNNNDNNVNNNNVNNNNNNVNNNNVNNNNVNNNNVNNDENKNDNIDKKMSDFVITKENFQRADMLDQYLKIVDPAYIGCINVEKNYTKCNICNCEKTLIQEEGIMVCEMCGDTEFVVIDSDRPSYKDPPPEISYFAYKRRNHYSEFLDHLRTLTTNSCYFLVDKLKNIIFTCY